MGYVERAAIIVCFRSGYDLSTENPQLSRNESLYYNKQFSRRHYRL